MTRFVEHDATGPLKLDPSDVDDEKGDVAVCRCGLSEDRPFCDGSHRATEGEADGERYLYDDGERRRVERIVLADGEERVSEEEEAATSAAGGADRGEGDES